MARLRRKHEPKIQSVKNKYSMDLGVEPLLQDERPPRDPPQGSQAQCYIFDVTVKAEGVTVDALHEKFREYAKRYVFQLEKGDGGYLHYQGRVTLFKKRRSAEIANKFNDNLFKAYFTPTSNNARERDSFYCIKADTRVDGPWRDSDYKPPIVYSRQMLEFMSYERYPWQQQVEQWCGEWDKRTIYWVYDSVGCNGKSDLVEYLHTSRIAVCVPPMRKLEDICQFCMTHVGKAYLIDFPRAMSKEYLSEFYSGIETLKNGYLYDKRYKGKSMFIDRPAIVIFSNTKPDTFAMSRDRWSIWEIEDRKLKPLNELATKQSARGGEAAVVELPPTTPLPETAAAAAEGREAAV